MENIELLKKGLTELGIPYGQEQIDKLVSFKDILIEWNEKINLTAITEEREVYIKHFIDSATCLLKEKIKDHDSVIDVGTGAGFPGVPVKLLKEDIKITLLDSLNKRINYLNDVTKRLNISGVEMVHMRAEEGGSDKRYREKFDVALSRAVASMNVLCEYCLPFVKVGGLFVCQKGPSYEEELREGANAIKALGGQVQEVEEYLLPGSDIKHYIIVIRKIAQTPAKFPRKPGKPAADPIK